MRPTRTPPPAGSQVSDTTIEPKETIMPMHARFWVNELTLQGNAEAARVTLSPVIRPTNDNIAWSKYTPSGRIELGLTTQGAIDWFQARLGKDVAITFADVEE